MNFAFYTFGNPGGKYSQFPDDHTKELLENQTIGLKRMRFSVCRRETLVYYVYQNKLSADSYIGFCIALNKIQTLKYNELIHFFNWLCVTDVVKKLFDTQYSYSITSFGNNPNVCEDLEKIVKVQLAERFDDGIIELKHAFNLSDTKYIGKIGIGDGEIYDLTCRHKIVELNNENGTPLTKKKHNVKGIVLTVLTAFLFGGLGYWIYENYQELSDKKQTIRQLETEVKGLKDSLENYQNANSDLIADRNSWQIKYNNLQSEYNNFKSNPLQLIETLKKDPIIILKIEVCNDGEGYNQQIHSSNTTYIHGKTHYYSAKNQKVTLKIKFYYNNELRQGKNSPSDCSYTEELQTIADQYSTFECSGWGGKNKGHWSAGSYRYEVWYGDKCLGVKHFTVY